MQDLLCFSHLRWDFVFQRPQHLMTRFSAEARVFYIEEFVWSEENVDSWQIRKAGGSEVRVVVPNLSSRSSSPESITERIRRLVNSLIMKEKIRHYVSWYYSPMALAFSDHLKPDVTVYDCMDELSAFHGAPPELVSFESKLFGLADLVFTGGHRLYESKKKQHKNIFPYPSSIDKAVFSPARLPQADPADQAAIPHPRLGFFGVIDERFDISLVKELASLRPDWQFVYIGPVVKIDPASLPDNANIHYLGIKDYKQLPRYIAGWDICIMPFAINASTEFISPTKTPEFLAAGKKVISTPIHDVVHPYWDNGLVGIAGTAVKFAEIASGFLQKPKDEEWLAKADLFLKDLSWDKTWQSMKKDINAVLRSKTNSETSKAAQNV